MKAKYNALRGKIVEVYGSMSNFAKIDGRCLTQIRNIVSGRTNMTKPMIMKWSRLLNVEDPVDFYNVFFSW